MINTLKETYYRLINELEAPKKRYLYSIFNLKERLTGIIGPRGVGKTTLMLQYIKNKISDLNKAFYFSADHISFSKITLFEFVEQMYNTDGMKIFFIDEVHKYKTWNQELKNIYDAFPMIKIVFSGSSSLDLIKGQYDLSRRAVLHYLSGLSFREYLNFVTDKNYPIVSLSALIKEHQKIVSNISSIPKLQGHFKEYLQNGYYPFVFENPATFFQKLMRIIEKTVYEDIANYFNLKTSNLHLFLKILYFASTTQPGELNVHNLAQSLKVDDKTALHYLYILKDTGLIRLLFADKTGHTLLRKPEKMYLENTTLYHCLSRELGRETSIGTVRELFFLNTLENSAHLLTYQSGMGDFNFKDYTFEIGGKGKQLKKGKMNKKVVLVKDDILIGSPNEIPLYLFGFLY